MGRYCCLIIDLMKKWLWLVLLALLVTIGTIFLHKPLMQADWSLPFQPGISTPTESYSAPQPRADVESAAIASFAAVNAPEVSPERLLAHLQALSFSRYTPGDRLKARQYILRTLRSSGWSPQEQAFPDGVNIVAERSGTNPQAGTILVGAHYDTVAVSPGADDNATGVAAVLEIARLLGSRPTPQTLKLVLFDREETGLLGSLAFTSKASNIARLNGAIVLDMIGFACYAPKCQKFPEGLPVTPPSDRGDFLAVAGDAEHLSLLKAFAEVDRSGLPSVLTLPVPFKGVTAPDLLRSDHAPFWWRGIGAVIVSDTANFRTPHYHQPSDLPNTIDRDFFIGSAQIVTNATTRLLETGNGN
jgi:Zn-dependent M28 family amino/carboxypeptidase